MTVDFYASERHYADHLFALWFALPASERGMFHVERSILRHLALAGVQGTPVRPPAGPAVVVVAGYSDSRMARGAGRRVVYVEHGAGQTYTAGGVDPHPSYSGGPDHDGTVLFVSPSETVAGRWRAAYPEVPAVAVGVPKLDGFHAGPPRARARTLAGAVVAITFHCFPGDVRVSGPPVVAASARWYEGELVRITVAGGDELSCTPNHPILTPRGWVAAGRLNEGDHVIRRVGGKGMVGGHDPYEMESKPRIEDVARSLRQLPTMRTVRVPAATENFHGDGRGSDIDVVWANGHLMDDGDSPILKPFSQSSLVLGDADAPRLSSQCALDKLGALPLETSHCPPLFLGLSSDVFFGALASGEDSGLRTGADDVELVEQLVDGRLGDAVVNGNAVGGFPRPVPTNDRRFVATKNLRTKVHDGPFVAYGDAPRAQDAIDNRRRNAELAGQRRSRFAGEVSTARIVFLRRDKFAGHVHSLQTTEGWHLANGFVVSNSDVALCSESRSAFRHYNPALPAVVGALRDQGATVVGHAHPRLWRHVAGRWAQAGAEPVEDLVDVLGRADVLCVDNSSVLYEASSCGIPTVAMNAPWYRRGVHHGLRFWNLIPGAQVDGPAGVPGAVVEALADPPWLAERRAAVVAEVYAACDGKAAARAADAILSVS